MSQVHAHGSAFTQNWIGAIVLAPAKQFGSDAQRLIGGMSHPKHPLIAAHCAHAAADLIGERLKCQTMIRRGKRAADGIDRALGSLHGEKSVDGFFKAALEEMLVTFEGDERRVMRDS